MQVLAGKDLMNDPAMLRDAFELEGRSRQPTEKDFDDAALDPILPLATHGAGSDQAGIVRPAGRREVGEVKASILGAI